MNRFFHEHTFYVYFWLMMLGTAGLGGWLMWWRLSKRLASIELWLRLIAEDLSRKRLKSDEDLLR